jgi:serine/threonine protein kinase
MTPDRWQTIERLYHATLEQSASERGAFLAAACQGDDELRAEVESLIAHGLDAPAVLDAQPSRELRAALARRFDQQPGAPGRHLGRTFGPYALQAVLAAGGMGEVYRATDTRLNRTVAIKILLHNPDRQQLTREAEIVSSLNHPHICTIHDIGSADGVDYIVMEYLEGETLQQRLTRGALPLAKAIEYCAQIVDALDKSHRRGIVHRDIKPANVMLTAVGVKVLDFGIATRVGGSDPAPVMATPPYGSPEQLAGQAVDARTDIFSFGAVAYEMIAGRRAFQGTTTAAAVASVCQDEPVALRDLIPAVPERLARTLSRCLAKAPDERWQTANDLLFELRSFATPPTGPTATDRSMRMPWIERAGWAAALGTTLILYALAGSGPTQVAESPVPDLRFELWPERETSYASSFDVPFALAPDGRRLAYVAIGPDGIKRLWVRTLDGTTGSAIEIGGSEDANTPFWSPDSVWVGFFSRHRLLKVRVSDRRVRTIATQVSTMAGATWNAEGIILFTGGPGGLSRVSADGGAVVAATGGEGSHFWPQFIGDGRHFIYAAAIPGEIRLGSLTGEPSRVLMKIHLNPSSLVYTRGYLFFGKDSTLFARAFDEATLEFVGEPVALLAGIPVTQLGRMPFSVSAAGPLAVWPYPGGAPATLRWFTETGASAPVVETPARYVGLALAPDAGQLAVSRRHVHGGADIWVRDLNGSTETQLTFDGTGFAPRWSADGGRLVFTSPTRLPPRLLIKSLQDSTADVELGGSRLPAFASSWSGDGARIVSVRIDPATRDDLYVDYVEDGRFERLPMNTSGNDYQAVVSPDDRWLAYVTDASGRDEVWVASFPSGQVRRQVSSDGGTSPQWTDHGRELAYLSQRKWLTIRSFTATGGGIVLGTPRELFDAAAFVETTPLVTPTANAYVAAVDGRRFLAAVRANDSAVPPIQLIVDWRTLLRSR